ncbi:hypothetical protein T05_6043 [Trichinella murrelli]|uniref:Uncharacterized protein n=1 Tax=Trichinella murrelli TaxID=144512 RepID=A0A0V0T231_9BILA|nr:hypothetical protein T05_6043 [Trichinella murrelli]
MFGSVLRRRNSIMKASWKIIFQLNITNPWVACLFGCWACACFVNKAFSTTSVLLIKVVVDEHGFETVWPQEKTHLSSGIMHRSYSISRTV